jgi:hypothetical protein
VGFEILIGLRFNCVFVGSHCIRIIRIYENNLHRFQDTEHRLSEVFTDFMFPSKDFLQSAQTSCYGTKTFSNLHRLPATCTDFMLRNKDLLQSAQTSCYRTKTFCNLHRLHVTEQRPSAICTDFMLPNKDLLQSAQTSCYRTKTFCNLAETSYH